ncbi:ADP-ribosylation factor, putative [Plasmodium ovale]|uniref:ADP-ribosylation factor, putative n=1 Tax=Plasmodium ovale TaxID=36330 RepID=A0A1C3KQS7_PLAOA|nr:ADP-ribosylation factor, putative [Plasmodium ovale]
MGNVIATFFRDCCNKFFNKKIIFQIRICGPAQSGKTTFVKYLLHNKFLKVKPTEVEKIDFEEFSVIIWDSRYSIEDDASINRLDMDAVIYFIDLSDHGRLKIGKKTECSHYKRIKKVKSRLRCYKDYNHIDNFLIVASKSDKKNCMLLQHIKSELKIDQIVDRNW